MLTSHVIVLAVVRCESEGDVDIPEIVENADLGIVGDDIQDFGEASLSPAPGVDTVCLFPKNPGKCKIWYYSLHF